MLCPYPIPHTHHIKIPHHLQIPLHTHHLQIPLHTHHLQIPLHTHHLQIPLHTHHLQIPLHTHHLQQIVVFQILHEWHKACIQSVLNHRVYVYLYNPILRLFLLLLLFQPLHHISLQDILLHNCPNQNFDCLIRTRRQLQI